MNKSHQYRLKLLTQKDSTAFYTLIQDNLVRLEDFFAGTVAKTRTLEATQAYCKEILDKIDKKEYFPYLIFDDTSEKVIGLIDVKNIRWNIPKGELGAFIDANFEGKGIVNSLGSDLINQIVEEHKFKKLYCRVGEKNRRSIQLVERLGFILEGTIRRDYKTTKGELVDLNYYGKLFD